ncbi:hypothetical protein SAMN03159341_13125 [Paenibacillus sp. 1_12]|uniref:GNAT family N-acetyltransferase n=1 Tax=Paenibacillus sp. 1_12 TaxID=1566278 RepID=UPI0008EBAE93|nr:hypothetical protein [Paenibacillus sp. 1_12]SFM40490.1 hypothetical protein SAMN03159341_13125 [Paenibacillus sp. 1_12]
MKIRQEKPSDYEEVYQLLRASFATSSHADGTEPDYLNEVRKKDTFVPELSLVAENEDGKLVGQVVLYETWGIVQFFFVETQKSIKIWVSFLLTSTTFSM